jgi:hypothetical protein
MESSNPRSEYGATAALSEHGAEGDTGHVGSGDG